MLKRLAPYVFCLLAAGNSYAHEEETSPPTAKPSESAPASSATAPAATPTIATTVTSNPNEPLAKVNDKLIIQQDFDNYVRLRSEQGRPADGSDVQGTIQELINREMVLQDALKTQLDKNPDFIKRAADLQNNLLVATAVRNYLEKHPFSDEVLKQEYNKQVAKLKMPQEYNARHILVDSEENAKAIIAELGQGKDFGELAKTKSMDKASAEKNGELGWLSNQQVVAAFAEAMTKLEKGKYTTSPVKTDFGWHIIRVDDIRDVAPPPFDTVKENIRMSLQSQKVQEYVNELKKTAKIEILKKTEPTPAKVDEKSDKVEGQPTKAPDATPKPAQEPPKP